MHVRRYDGIILIILQKEYCCWTRYQVPSMGRPVLTGSPQVPKLEVWKRKPPRGYKLRDARVAPLRHGNYTIGPTEFDRHLNGSLPYTWCLDILTTAVVLG